MRILFVLALALVLGLVAGPTVALAEHRPSTLNVDATDAIVGDSLALSSFVSWEDGEPVAGAEVIYSYLAGFGGSSSFVVIGRAVTDQQGVAVFDFRPKAAGDIRVRAEVTLNGEDETTVSTTTIPVAASTERLYEERGGIHIFGHEWILVVVLTSVWFVLFLVALGIADIATGFTDARGTNDARKAPSGTAS